MDTPVATDAVSRPGSIAAANWPDAVRGFYVTVGACFIAHRVPEKADLALLVLVAIASPALFRAILDRFKR